MSRLDACFSHLRTQQRTALITFLTAGDGGVDLTVRAMHAMVQAGVNVIELGIPFSDPMADGPVIQAASERALAAGIGLQDVWQCVRDFRQQDTATPVILMGYLNPLEAVGYADFVQASADAGVDALLIVDLPVEASEQLHTMLQKHGMDQVFLLAPTTTTERMRKVCAAASGFIYYVSLKGVTGSADLDVLQVQRRLAEVKQLTDLPVGVGFGIKTAAQAGQMASCSDAVVVGSAVVSLFAQGADKPDELLQALRDWLATCRRAMDVARAS